MFETQIDLTGSRYLATHQASVESILGSSERRVVSKGDTFENIDSWTFLILLQEMDAWHRRCPDQQPDRAIISRWALSISQKQCPDPHIRIPATPDRLPARLMYALVEGIYHECWHTLYSLRGPLHLDHLLEGFQGRWERLVDISISGNVVPFYQILEDIRIEGLGMKMFPGTAKGLTHLHDFVLSSERDLPSLTRQDVCQCLLRDFGHQHKSDNQNLAFERYREHFPDVWGLFQEEFPSLILKKLRQNYYNYYAPLWLAIDFTSWLSVRDPTLLSEPAVGPRGFQNRVWSTCHVTSPSSCRQNVNSALSDAIQSTWANIVALDQDERPWRPYDTSQDEIVRVEIPWGQNLINKAEASLILSQVRSTYSVVRSQIFALSRSWLNTGTYHGARTGTKLSEQKYADVICDLMDNKYPESAFEAPQKQIDHSVRVILVMDLSRSMRRSYSWLTHATTAIADLFDLCGFPVMILGIQDKPGCIVGFEDSFDDDRFHRFHAVQYLIFKDFHEKLPYVLPRLMEFPCRGRTPLSDGIHAALQILESHQETVRMLYVITDGVPDMAQIPVIKMQQRTAREKGILVIGIGLGWESRSVVSLFEHYVWTISPEDFPEALIKKNRELLTGGDSLLIDLTR